MEIQALGYLGRIVAQSHRYAPGSVKFDDAAPAPLDQIQKGDQLRARGQRSADGGELTADEVVSGSFRNISGTINLVDASANTITVTIAALCIRPPLTARAVFRPSRRDAPARRERADGPRDRCRCAPS